MKTTVTILFIQLICFSILGCTSKPTHPSLEQKGFPPLIPIRDLFLNTESEWMFALSPDGEKLAWIGGSFWKRGSVMRFKNLENDKVIEFEGHNKRDHFGSYFWAGDSQHLIFSQDDNGSENFGIFYVNIDNPEEIFEIAYDKKSRSYVAGIPRHKPNVLHYVSNKREESVFDLYEYDFKTKSNQLIGKNPGNVTRWITDSNGALYAAVFYDTADNYSLYRYQKKLWGKQPLATWGVEDQFDFLGFSSNPEEAWFHSNLGRDKVALVKFHFETGKEEVIHASEKVDLSRSAISQLTGKPLHSLSFPDYPDNYFFDQSLKNLINQSIQEPYAAYWLGADREENKWLVQIETDLRQEVYLIDKKHKKLTLLSQDPLSKHYSGSLSSSQPFSFTAEDGMTIHGYITLPAGIKAEKLPTVVWVHGGPWVRDYWYLNSRAQFFANRGYAVIQVNYRGSTGYGRQYLKAAKREFAGKMHTDIIDAANWAVDQGYSDPSSIAIYGRSYGGYATLVGLSFTPNYFQCGVDIVGPSNLVSSLKNTPKHWKFGVKLWHDYAGNPNNPEDITFMQSRSPLFHVNNIEKPLLIFQGKHDSRVKASESEQMVEALKKAGKKVDYILFDNEGHQITHWKNRLVLHRNTEKFLHKCLGGRDRGFDFYEVGKWLPFL